MAVVIDGTNGISSPDYEVDGVTGQIYPLVSGTAVTASGTAVNFTGIPSWAKRITVMLSGVSTNGTSEYLIQLGDSGGIENTGYTSQASAVGGSSATSSSTAGFNLLGVAASAAGLYSGIAVITALGGGNSFVASGTIARSAASTAFFGGSKTLSDTLTQVRITTVNGTDAFDAGTINIIYE